MTTANWVCKPGLFGLEREVRGPSFDGFRSLKPRFFKDMTLPVDSVLYPDVLNFSFLRIRS